jgi:hypothetical protein
MSGVIKLVQNDNLPEVTLTLTDKQNGDPLDLSASTTTVVVKFRARGTTTVLSILSCSKPNGGADGVVRFGFPSTSLDVAEGNYEGEIEISFNGVIQTVFDTLQFYVRKEF